MLITKLATIHGDRLRVRKQVPASGGPVPEPTNLIYVWCNDFRERVPRPIKARLDSSEVALGDLRDLLVGHALELPQNEHISVVLGQLRYALLDNLSQVTLPVHVIGPRRGILELERAIFVLKVLLDRLKENQRIPRAIPQLILGQVGRDRIDPSRELFRPIKPMQVSINPDENFLHQIFRLFPVADGAIDEVQKTRLIARYEL